MPRSFNVCVNGGHALFLDIERNRYFRLAPNRDATVRALIEGESICEDELQALLRLGIVVEQGIDAVPLAPPSVIPPARSLVEHQGAECSGPHWPLLPEIAWLLAVARARLRWKEFASVMKSLAARKESIEDNVYGADDVALAFVNTRRLAPFPSVCLADSLALLAFLLRRDIRADLVIGVKSRPFGAHCWVQRGDIILNSPLDDAAMFTPILVV
jgi:hypothetical protein